MSWAEAKWIHDKLLQATGKAPDNMRMFTSEVFSKSSIGLKFLEPADTYVDGNLACSVGGVMIRMSETDYPQSVNDGTLVVDNAVLGKYETESFVVNGLVENKTYYFSAFPYSTQGVYKVSDRDANRVTAVPKDGELVNVTINIDDASAFNAVVVTLVNETNPSASQTATMTPSIRNATFAVPIGDSYHVEYGEAEGYSKPANTTSKVSQAGAVSDYSATYYYFTATIDVEYPEGATCTCYYGDIVYTAPDKTGTHQFRVHAIGTWTVKAVKDDETASTQVLITSDGQSVAVGLSFAKIYGISRDITSSSPVWARTDDAVGFTATATIGTNAGSSDFGSCYPWNGITRATFATGDVMVKIPKFYFRRYREGNIEHIQIADKKTTGFTLHPAFNHAGVEKDSVYVGAYKTSGSDKSLTGASALQRNLVRADARTRARAKGAGWGLLDISTLSAIQMLILVEFATNDVQSAIGVGRTGSTLDSPRGTGQCDSVTNLTGVTANANTNDVVWRGVEGFWGNLNEWVDGVQSNAYEYYVCNDPSKYTDENENNYVKLSYSAGAGGRDKYITSIGLCEGNSHILLPDAMGSGGSSTYYCDAASVVANRQLCAHGGYWNNTVKAGLFHYTFDSVTDGWTEYGSRLMYIPQ